MEAFCLGSLALKASLVMDGVRFSKTEVSNVFRGVTKKRRMKEAGDGIEVETPIISKIENMQPILTNGPAPVVLARQRKRMPEIPQQYQRNQETRKPPARQGAPI